MRWIKHLSNSQDDEILSELITEFGAEGYGIWWIILEKIAAQIEQNPSTKVRYSAKKWANFCEVSVQRFRKVIHLLEKKMPTFVIADDGRYIQVDCPNILKYCDNWTLRKLKKPGKSVESLGSSSVVGEGNPSREVEVEVEVEVEKNKPKKKKKKKKKKTEYSLKFKEFIKVFGDNRGQVPAYEKSWCKIPDLDDNLYGKIIEGAKRYAIERKNILAKGGTSKMAQGWLKDRRWEDEVENSHFLPQTETEKKNKLFQAYIQDEAQQNEKRDCEYTDVVDAEDSSEAINPAVGALSWERANS